jgi:hypothetical protein
MNEIWHVITPGAWSSLYCDPPLLAQTGEVVGFFESIGSQIGGFLPSLLGAIAILILGWLGATFVAKLVQSLLKRTEIDNRIAQVIMGQEAGAEPPPIEKWIATTVYWIIMTFVLVAFLNALRLEVVSEPLNSFLQQIFNYLPKVGGALVLLGLAWALATVAKLVLTRGLARFNLDDRLAQQSGAEPGESPFLVNETLGNALYWFILLFFVPLILQTLGLDENIEPVRDVLNAILSALPRILVATIIAVVGWFIARIVRGIVTNLLAATGIDRLGEQFGLRGGGDALSLSTLIGTIVYVLILVPTAISALEALEIEAISEPAIAMLQTVINYLPLFLAAGLILAASYIVGRFVSDLVASFLRSLGFNNVLTWLGLPQVEFVASEPAEPTAAAPGMPEPYVRPTAENQLQAQVRTPSEIVGLIVMIAIVLLGAVAATEVLQFQELTSIVRAVLRVSLRVLSGIVVFGIGLYLSNLAFNLLSSLGTAQSKILGQTARIAIIALVSAMALQQMGIATNIVNLAFGLLLGAIAVAIALAFGLGGRDIAAEQIREWLNSFKQQS